MAAKVALVATVGCSGSAPRPAPTPAPTPGNVSAAPPADTLESCKTYLGTLQQTTSDKLAADDPLHGKPNVYGAFADRAARSSPRTQTCCEMGLEHDGGGAPARFACCSAVAESAQSVAACTPWGPPSPPEMLA